MIFTKEEMHDLEKAWKINIIIWGAIFISLPVYLIICKLLEKQQVIGIDPDLPLNMLSGILIGVSVITFYVTYLIRKKMLQAESPLPLITSNKSSSVSWVNQVTARYTGAMVLSAALSESVGIYGFVIFLLSQDSVLLYQFLFLSAVAMYYFRPRKDELMAFAAKVKKQI